LYRAHLDWHLIALHILARPICATPEWQPALSRLTLGLMTGLKPF
jgi:hypothetical protein